MTWFNDLWARFGKIIPLVENPSDPTKGMNLKGGANGGLAVEGVAGGTAIPVSGTVTATVDTAALATHAKQDVSKAVLDAILAKIIAAPATQTTLADVLAKIIAAPATEGKQDTGNTSLAAILAKIIAAPATEAKQTALNAYAEHGTWYPAVQVAPADSNVIRAAPCTVRRAVATNVTAAAVILMLFDDADGVANNTYPRLPAILIPARTTVELPVGGLVCANGLCWASSSTYGLLTVTALTPLTVSAEVV